MVKPSRILGNRVFVLVKKREEHVQGGIIIPTTVNQSLETGMIMMKGDQVINVQEGDEIIFPAGAGIPHEIDGKPYRFLDGPTIDAPGHIIAII